MYSRIVSRGTSVRSYYYRIYGETTIILYNIDHYYYSHDERIGWGDRDDATITRAVYIYSI